MYNEIQLACSVGELISIDNGHIVKLVRVLTWGHRVTLWIAWIFHRTNVNVESRWGKAGKARGNRNIGAIVNNFPRTNCCSICWIALAHPSVNGKTLLKTSGNRSSDPSPAIEPIVQKTISLTTGNVGECGLGSATKCTGNGSGSNGSSRYNACSKQEEICCEFLDHF